MRPGIECAIARVVIAVVIGIGVARPTGAQSLNWEGQTGGVIAPFATVATSPRGGIGRPLVSFGMLDTGDVVGTRFQLSIVVPLADRVEVGYTKSAVKTGSAGDLSDLFDRGFQNIHGKVRLVDEDVAPGVPAIAAGARFRWQRADIEGGEPMRNVDLYVVATKAIPAGRRLSVVLDGGVRVTNASLFAIAGSAPDWTVGGFGAAALDFGYLMVGGEIVQQPKQFEGLPGSDMPASVSGFGRLVLVRNRLSVDIALVRFAGTIAPGLDIRAENRLALGTTVRF